ncbi:MAG: hypothetical protein H6825_10185 [Planctomycetes bacterium]|nr:hypothetical protein [Planctomycetota bacterium]
MSVRRPSSWLVACAPLSLCLAAVLASSAQAQADPGLRPLRQGDPVVFSYDEPFFGDAHHDASIPSPDDLLGQPLGSRIAHHDEILRCFDLWARQSPRMTLVEHGQTFEGRRLVHAIVTSEANQARLDDIRAALRRIDDPRGLSESEAKDLLRDLPAVAWMGYSIHGDETSGSDAALALAYHLVAGLDADVSGLLDSLVIVIDPCLNPDGRERLLGMVEQSAGRVPTLDHEAMQRGRWPWGRGNHYQFDMNRDWLSGTQPETRGRWSAARDLIPQLFVDAHEMGELDTFLFYPQADPHNPNLPPSLDRWQQVFADDAASAFDAHGWPYYTREWADAWAPFYSDAWGSLGGAVGMLYEQARTSGFALRDANGRIRTYREAVHRQLTASWANLRTLSQHRLSVLLDFAAQARLDIDPEAPFRGRAFALRPGSHPDRERALVSLLLAQGIEVYRTGDALDAKAADDAHGVHADELELPAGTLVVPVLQPEAPRVLAMLRFDERLDDASVLRERSKLERKAESGLYDVTAWSLPLLADLDALWIDAPPSDGLERVSAPDAQPSGGVVATVDGRPAFGWIVDGRDDRSVAFAARALEAGLAVHLSDEPFTSGGRSYPRGSLLVRRADNGTDVFARVQGAAFVAGVPAYATSSGRSPDDGPDLGGGHFLPLARPRVALLSDMPVRPDAFGHVWYHLDQIVGEPVSMLDAQAFDGYDLRRYNVLVLPAAFGLDGFVGEHAEALAEWVSSGGTLVALGDSAGAVAASGSLGSVVRRRDVLDDLDGYTFAAQRERAARDVTVDLAKLWGDASDDDGAASGADSETATASATEDALVDPDAARQDEWERRFAPAGAILRGLVDDEAWITSGCDAELPLLVSGDLALLSRSPVATPVRFAGCDRLRMAGLLWPEAAGRLADSAYLTVESMGAGQIVLFAGEPTFRGQTRGTARLLANAIVYGPGAGARQPVR